MTVSSTTNKISYNGDGANDAFDFTFTIFTPEDLVVILRDGDTGVEILQTLDIDYTVAAVNNDYSSGGTVTFAIAPTLGKKVVINRVLAIKQPADFDYNDELDSTKIEQGLDRNVMLIQQLAEVLARSVTVPVSDDVSGMELPSSIIRANKVLAFDAAGNPIATTGSVGDSTIPVSSFMESLLNLANAELVREAMELGDGALYGFKDEEDMASNATDAAASQHSIKAYIDNLVANKLAVAGEIKIWTTASSPSGWLICDGSAVSRETYADLFMVIGETFGDGDGETTFNLPDLRGRVPIGVGTGDADDATEHILGEKDGTEEHQLTVAEMPEHKHYMDITAGYSTLNDPANSSVAYLAGDPSGTEISVGSAALGARDYITSTGGNESHNNIQPILAVNFIIKY